MSDKRDEILNRLRKAKKELQESLQSEDEGIKKAEKIELVEGQKDIERIDRVSQIEEKEENKIPAKKLYKATEKEPVREVPKELKSNDGLSTKRLAAIQRTIRKKVMERQAMTPKQKALTLLAIVVAAMPLMMLNTVSLVSCRFDFNKFGLYYRGTPGSIMLTMPVTNPSFVPAYLSELELELYDANMGAVVARVSTNEIKRIEPYATVVIDIGLRLDPENAGKWISGMFSNIHVDQATGKISGLDLVIYIRNFKYNGMLIAKEVVLPKIPLSDLVSDLTSGLSFSGSPSSPVASRINQKEDNIIEAWKTYEQHPLSSASMELINLDVKDSETKFELTLEIGIELEALPNFYLGPLNIKNLNISLYGNHQNLGSGKREDYKAEVARLETLDPKDVTPTDYLGLERDVNSPIEVHFGGMTFVSAKLTLFKDDIGGALVHPSAFIDLNNKTKMLEFVQANGTKYPMWNFFNNLLAMAKVDALIEINNIDLNIFGVDIDQLEIPKELLPVIQMDNLFDFNDFVGAPIGIFGSIGFYTKLATQGMLGLNDMTSSLKSTKPNPAAKFDPEALGDMVKIESFDMSMIKESWGPTANLSVGLGITIENTLLDIYVGLFNVSLGLSNQIGDMEATFAFAKLLNADSGGQDIYIAGINSTTRMTVALTLMKNDQFAPFVAKFVRDLLEQFKLNARANLKIDNLIMFKQNYTFAGLEIGLDMSGLLDLKSMIEDLVKDAVSGLFEKNSTQNESTPESVNPFLYPLQLVLKMALGNPIMQAVLGNDAKLPGTITMKDESGAPINVPKAAQDIQQIEVQQVLLGTKISIGVANIELGEGSLPIFLALGYTDLRIQSRNQYGGWSDLIGLLQENYIEITDEKPFNVYAELMIYHGETLCNFLNAILYGRDFDVAIAGSISLNISGVWVPDIKLNLQIEKLNLGVNLTTMLSDLIAGMLDAQPNAIPITSQIQNTEQIKMWDGRVPIQPFQSQSISIDQFLKLGEIVIKRIEETGWPYVDQGQITVDLELGLKTSLMDIEIHNLGANLSDSDGHLLAQITLNNQGIIYLNPGIERMLEIRIVLIKSQYLQDYLANTLLTLNLTGKASVTLSLKIFGCLISNLYAELDISSLGLNVAELFNQMIPLSPYTNVNSPQASQDIMDLLGDFGLVYVQTGGAIYPVGSNNRNDPMFDVTLGVVLQPKFNMSILNADLQLLDKGIFDAIYGSNPAYLADAIEYSKIARVYIDPVWCNNTYAPEAIPNFGIPGRLPALPQGKLYWDVIDPLKPYYDTVNNNHTGAKGMKYAQQWNISTNEPMYKSYSLSTFAFTEAKLAIYNQSHGSFRNAYPKQYWRALGGPYFPVQTYGPEQGGYPKHRVVYHPYYSPVGNLLSSVSLAMSDVNALLSKLTFAGNISINIFSMNLTLDAQSPAVSSLISTLLEETQTYIRNGLYEAANPLAQFQNPTLKKLSIRNAIDKYYSGQPLPSALVMDLNIDMESLIDDYPLISLEVRNDHMYAPYLTHANELKFMGNNINPYDFKGRWRTDYNAGLYDPVKNPYGSNIESFVKDYHYESYKLVVENWRKSKGLIMNPFFETENKTFGDIQDHTLWPLRWVGDKGRTPSWVGMFIAGLVPRFELGILSAYITLWYDDPISGCSLVPMGYAWINNSIFPRPVSPSMPDPAHQNGGVIDDYGNTLLDCNWALLNIRLFHSRQTQAFFNTLLYDVEDLNLSFVMDATINASLFGYEIYNVGIGSMAIDSRSPFAIKCSGEFKYTEEGNIWGLPGQDGSIVPIEPPSEWPPKDMLPEYKSSSNILSLDGVFNGIRVERRGIDQLGGIIKIRLRININTPLPLHAWLNRIFGRAMVNNDGYPDWHNVTTWHEQAIVETGYIYVCLNRFVGENLTNPDPYDLRINTIRKESVNYPEPIQTPDVSISIEWSTLSLVLDSIDLWRLIWEGKVHFTKSYVWLQIQDLKIEVMLPTEFQYMSYIGVSLDSLTFNLAEMLEGTEVWGGLG